MKKNITLEYRVHRNKIIVKIIFDFDNEIKDFVKSEGASWSKTHRAWYVDFNKETIRDFINQLSKFANIDYSKLTKHNLPAIKLPVYKQLNNKQKEVIFDFKQYLSSQRFSESTIENYSYLVSEYLIFENNRFTTVELIQEYIASILVPRKIAISTHRQFVGAINHYLTHCQFGIELDYKTYTPRKERKLPNVLSKEEIVRLIQVTKNLKHRVCIALLYSSGLRIGELLNLKLKDVDFNRMLLKVEQGKGRKDRFVPIAHSILPMLNNYLNTYTPNYYLIENDIKKSKYSAESIRKFLRTSCKKASIAKRTTPHTLRHSYATHLLENGTDIRYIQTLLGHYRPETTMIYTHVQSQDLQKINNPLDVIVKQLMPNKNNSLNSFDNKT